MCFPFLAAQGHSVGDSLCAEEDVELAKRILAESTGSGAELKLPVDLVSGDRFAEDADTRTLDGVDVPDGWMGLDIGPRTAESMRDEIGDAGTVFWNGPMGAFELEPFAAGTRAVAEAVAAAPRHDGGRRRRLGRGAAAVRARGPVTHLSTGGGATLELIEGKQLPGVEALA